MRWSSRLIPTVGAGSAGRAVVLDRMILGGAQAGQAGPAAVADLVAAVPARARAFAAVTVIQGHPR